MFKQWETLYICAVCAHDIEPDHFIYCSCCTYLHLVQGNICTELGNIA